MILYFPGYPILGPRQDLAPAALACELGCQGFTEPDLSTLRYKINSWIRNDCTANVFAVNK